MTARPLETDFLKVLTVLYVEDEPHALEEISTFLRPSTWTLRAITTGCFGVSWSSVASPIEVSLAVNHSAQARTSPAWRESVEMLEKRRKENKSSSSGVTDGWLTFGDAFRKANPLGTSAPWENFGSGSDVFASTEPHSLLPIIRTIVRIIC